MKKLLLKLVIKNANSSAKLQVRIVDRMKQLVDHNYLTTELDMESLTQLAHLAEKNIVRFEDITDALVHLIEYANPDQKLAIHEIGKVMVTANTEIEEILGGINEEE